MFLINFSKYFINQFLRKGYIPKYHINTKFCIRWFFLKFQIISKLQSDFYSVYQLPCQEPIYSMTGLMRVSEVRHKVLNITILFFFILNLQSRWYLRIYLQKQTASSLSVNSPSQYSKPTWIFYTTQRIYHISTIFRLNRLSIALIYQVVSSWCL